MTQNSEDHIITGLVEQGFFNESKISTGACCVKVALRIRPQQPMERANDCKDCLRQLGTQDLTIGKERNFQFDRVFGQTSAQKDLFDVCIHNLILGCFEGYLYYQI